MFSYVVEPASRQLARDVAYEASQSSVMVPHSFALITVACGPSRQVLYLCDIILLHSSLWPVALLVFCVLQVEVIAVLTSPCNQQLEQTF